MKWLEFKQLLSGLGPDTVLGRIVSIRAEDDKDILKHFSREQHRIRNEWLSRRVIDIPQKDVDMFLEELKQGFIRMAGGASAYE